MSAQAWGVSASVTAGVATAAGSVLIFWVRELSSRTIAVAMGIAAGAMLSASIFSLLLPAAATLPLSTLLLSAGAGVLILHLADLFAPFEKLAAHGSNAKQAGLIVLAMALHNFPEGLAVGVSFGAPDFHDGFAVTSGVLFQDLPEGLVTALALMTAHYKKAHVFWIVALTGVVEMLGGLVGVAAMSTAQSSVPLLLSFAAGAMGYVVLHELVPEALRTGHLRLASAAIVAGGLAAYALG